MRIIHYSIFLLAQATFIIEVPSDWGKVGKRSDINRNWIHFINDGRSYPYLPGLSIPDINELLKLRKGQ